MSLDNKKNCDIHQNQIRELYCENCKLTICARCITPHKIHSVVHVNDYLINIQPKLEQIVEKLNNDLAILLQNKQSSTAIYLQDVEQPYQTQVENVTKNFRELHDQLHVKEVEIKRELKSYYDENNEKYVESLSKYDFDIEQYQNTLKSLQDPQDITNSSTVIESFDQSIKNLPQVNNEKLNSVPSKYSKSQLNEKSIKTAEKSILSISLLNINPQELEIEERRIKRDEEDKRIKREAEERIRREMEERRLRELEEGYARREEELRRLEMDELELEMEEIRRYNEEAQRRLMREILMEQERLNEENRDH